MQVFAGLCTGSHVKLLDAAKYRTGLMFKRAQNGKLGHTNLLIKSLMIHIDLLPFTSKHVQLNMLVTQDLSFLVYFPLSNLKVYLILVFVQYVFLLQ